LCSARFPRSATATPARSCAKRLRLLEEQEQEQERAAKLKSLRQAAKLGFDEIDQGKGIVLSGKKAINQFIMEIEDEVREATRPAQFLRRD
jgi:hypothetical protein